MTFNDPHNEPLLIELSNDKLLACLTITNGIRPITRAEIDSVLKNNNVVHGIKEDTIEMILRLQQKDERFIIAKGTEPVDGENARIEYKFDTEDSRGRPQEMVDGRVDFYNLNLIQNVSKGQVLALKKPAMPGTPGKTVLGTEIPAKAGRDVHMVAGKNVELRDDNLTAVATANGYVVISGNKIGVSQVYQVPGNVDLSTGNIDFNGTVIIRGNIIEGFKVVAEGNVEVAGSIHGSVDCRGTLQVKNGIVGTKDTIIRAEGSIVAKFIQNSQVYSEDEVIAGEAIMHSNVYAKNSIKVGGKGVIVGGIVSAGESIICKNLGSQVGAITEVETGVNPEMRKQYAELKKQKQVKSVDLEKATKAINLLQQLRATQTEMHPDKKALLLQVIKTQDNISREIVDIDGKLLDIETYLEQAERGRILAQEYVWPGVKITIGSSIMMIKDRVSFVCFTKDGEQIKISSFS